jgi:hypothetical protein
MSKSNSYIPTERTHVTYEEELILYQCGMIHGMRPSTRGSQTPPLKRCRLTWNGHCPIPSKRFGDVSALK